jgi:hypothetical protein
MTPAEDGGRGRLRRALAHYFAKRGFPRQRLALLILVTGSVGFFVSAAMLKLGVTSMALRYPVAVLVSWSVLLGLIRVWVELEKRRFDPEAEEFRVALQEDVPSEPAERVRLLQNRHSWLDWLDVPDFGSLLDADEGCLPVVLVMAVFGLVVVLVLAIVGAPTLLAEVFLDVFIATVLYRRLKRAVKGNWLATAIRGTWGLTLLTAALLGVIGWALQAMAPEADSIGPALRELFE